MSSRSHARRAMHASVAVSAALGLAIAAPTAATAAPVAGGPLAAAPLPATYTADAHGDVVRLQSDLLTGGLADVSLAHGRTRTDSQGSPRVRATSRNLDLAVGGGDLPSDEVVASAPPSSDPERRDLLAVPLAPVATAGVLSGDVGATWVADDQCVPAGDDGTRVLGSSDSQLAGLTLLGLRALPGGLGSVATVAASRTTTSNVLVDRLGEGARVVARTSTSVGDIEVLGGLARVEVANPVTLTARSDGTTGSTEYSDPDVRVRLANRTIRVQPNGIAVDVPVRLGLLDISMSVTAFSPERTVVGAGAEAELDAVVSVDLTVDSALGEVADVTLGAGAMSVAAQAPAGGVECPGPDAVDSDGDGLTDVEEADLGTDPNDPDTDNDGLTDGTEVNDTDTDPLDPDTDDGGVRDGAEIDRNTDPNDATDDLPASRLDPDGDGLTNDQETRLGTDPNDPDTDNDGLTDGTEVNDTDTDPLDPDTDDGGVNDGTEVGTGTDPLDGDDDLAPTGDRDGDGLTDADEADLGTDPNDPDTDNDGLTDGTEVNRYDTDPLDPDTDDGGVLDGTEVANGTNPLLGADDLPPVTEDSDGDGLSDGREIDLGTNPNRADTDGDGLSDGREVDGSVAGCADGTDPLDADTDNDGLSDGREVNGMWIGQKVQRRGQNARAVGRVRTNPCRVDTDGDGLRDGREVDGVRIGQKVFVRKGSYFVGSRQSDPTVRDTDRDGLTDSQEVNGSRNRKFNKRRSDPTNFDTDRGRVGDGQEIRRGSDPSSSRSTPKNPAG